MNQRQYKKALKKGRIQFRKLKLNKDDILILDFKDKSYDFINQYAKMVRDKICPNNKIMIINNGMKLGILEIEK